MPEYDDKNRGALWSNKANMRPDKNDPHWTGSVNVEIGDCPHCGKHIPERDHWLNVWPVKSDKEKAPVMSLSVKRKEKKGNGPKEPKGGSMENELDDEIPF